MIVDFKPTEKAIEQTEVKTILLTHDFQTLKKMFYDFLNINIPKDIMLDENYSKINTAQILSYFVLKILNNQSINIQDKLTVCKFCNEWFYFQTLIKDQPYVKNVCRVCYVKEIESSQKIEEVMKWN